VCRARLTQWNQNRVQDEPDPVSAFLMPAIEHQLRPDFARQQQCRHKQLELAGEVSGDGTPRAREGGEDALDKEVV